MRNNPEVSLVKETRLLVEPRVKKEVKPLLLSDYITTHTRYHSINSSGVVVTQVNYLTRQPPEHTNMAVVRTLKAGVKINAIHWSILKYDGGICWGSNIRK
jgi:hypothetical protein